MDKVPSTPAELDAERAQLIGSLYEVVLSPAHFDVFMSDWARFIDNVARRLGHSDVDDQQSNTGLLNDPVIEAHFDRAFSLFERIGRGSDSQKPQQSEPILRIGRAGKIVDRSPDACAVLGDGFSLQDLRARMDSDSARRFDAFISAFERAPSTGRFAVLALDVPLAETDRPTHVICKSGLLSMTSTRAHMSDVLVVELRAMDLDWSDSLSALLAQSFSLTRRESDLVRDLSSGADLKAIAHSSGRSLNTLRTQLKSVFAKTRTKSQVELMRLVAMFCLHTPAGNAGPMPPTLAPDEHRIDLGDGRVLPVMDYGDPDGVPVVFLHGVLDGLAALNLVSPLLSRYGLRIIAPVRANYGQAAADDRVDVYPEIFARDLAVMLDTMGLPKAVLLGHQGGAIYAFAFAALFGSRVAGMMNVAGTLPVRSIAQFAHMPTQQRAVAYTARFAPTLLPAILRAGMAQIDSRDPKSFTRALYPDGSRDRVVTQDETIAAAMVEGHRFGVAQGTRNVLGDWQHAMRDWSAYIEASTCPVRLIHGAQDPLVPSQFVEALAAQSSRIEATILPGEGQLLFYSASGEVLTVIRDQAKVWLGDTSL